MELVFPFLIIILASFFQGSFGLGMKYMAPLKWEAWWLVHVTIAMVIFPVIWTYLAVPETNAIISSSFAQVPDAVRWAIAFGFLWGIGGILFGVSVPYIGLSLTMGIVMGLAGTLGSLIPLLQKDDPTSLPQFPYVVAGLVVTLIGVGITAKAGVDRDKVVASDENNEKSSIVKGILIAVICGALSSLLAVGHTGVYGEVAIIAEGYGVEGRNASLVAWLIVFMGAFGMNALYSMLLLLKNKSWSSFTIKGSRKSYYWALVAGICWFAALGLYGQGSALMGELGNILGWPMLLGLSLIMSNIWAYRAGEWEGAKEPFRLLLVGLVVLIVASIVLGYANQV